MLDKFWDEVLEARDTIHLIDANMDMYRYYDHKEEDHLKDKELKEAERLMGELEKHVAEARRLLNTSQLSTQSGQVGKER